MTRRSSLGAATVALSLPLAAQSYDLRFEVPFPTGQSLPQTLLSGSSQMASGGLDTGRGGILTLERRLIALPVFRLTAGLEGAHLKTTGTVQVGAQTQASDLTQSGLGFGLHTQFWIPFTGLAGELGLIQRLQHYRYRTAGVSETHDLSRTWLRVGTRWRLPLIGLHPYVAASYQQPLNKRQPLKLSSAADLASYLQAQGPGQEFQRMWTFGVGIAF